jgi:hypothetical protein
MKLLIVHRAVGLVVLASSLFAHAAASQRELTKRDKSQIIQFILRTYDFKESDTWRDNSDNTVLLLDENISPADIPARNGIKFRLVKHTELDRLRSGGVEYYQFRPFETAHDGVRVSFVRTYRSLSDGGGNVMEYICRKVGSRWKLKARLDGVYAS